MEKKQSVLIISYLFPPIGGGGIPRALKMAKYLGEYNWNVHVLTTDPAYHATLDNSLLAQVPADVQIHRAKELTSLLRKPAPAIAKQTTGKTEQGTESKGDSTNTTNKEEVTTTHTVSTPSAPSLLGKFKGKAFSFAKKIKSYILIPDDQILWYPEAVKAGRKLLREKKIDVIFSTSGPVTNHLVARKLAEEFGCKWIADFRDPWTQNMHRSGIGWRERLEEKLEEKVMRKADVITTVTATFAKNFTNKYPSQIQRVELIYNGFDRADFRDLMPVKEVPGRFHAAYAGILYQKRNPRLLLAAIKELIDEGKVNSNEISLSFAGVFDYPGYTENQDCVNALGLQDVVRVLGNLPHKEALGLMKGADALLMIGDVTPDAGAYIPGKLYEYMGVGKPILALHMPGEAADIIRSFQLGQVADPMNKEAIKEAYYKLFQAWKQEQETSTETKRDESFYDRVRPYERREQAGQLARLMNEVVGQKTERDQADPTM
ncbi:glycosyltransferase family 4 protein [Brevibacillus daliensis]|uniref:glycosyltransferase family 4 protein n=1 Tax=Brevibacillus daliensis TaxID=2892995 RepID=UPI001E4302C5|nr:glycosyltransferase family 4 protein [Brevibacillus daliensis]